MARLHRVECLDCGLIAIRMIYMDVPVYCRRCRSEALMWTPTA
jgi:hypothetical protein